MEFNSDNEPRLAPAGQGSCILNTVLYKGKALYSKYNPERTIISLIQNLNILPGTLVIAASPLLCYGLNDLKTKLPEDCPIIFCELQQELYDFSINSTENFCRPENPNKNKFTLYSQKDFILLDGIIRNLCQTGKIKRAIKIDFSAGVQFCPQSYQALISGITEIISTFWKNRLTLQKMGKLYTLNIFKNLHYLKNDQSLSCLAKTIDKPILVLGAGESLSTVIGSKDLINDNFFIIASDAALIPLLKAGIKINACVALECQSAIESAYLGCHLDGIIGIFDLTSRPSIPRKFKNRIWFSSEFADCCFLKTLQEKNIIKDTLPPMGSVGLAAIKTALIIRKSEQVPIFFSGLDFSFSKGFTHAKGTFPFIRRSFLQTRKISIENYDACWNRDAIKLIGKDGKEIYSTKILSSYAELFIKIFSSEKNIFDTAPTGIDLKTQKISFKDACLKAAELSKNIQKTCSYEIHSENKNAEEFLTAEKDALLKAKDILSNGENSKFRIKEISIQEQIKDLLKDRDYLFLHFPDGFSYKDDSAFLKRVRAEIDSFLKILEHQTKPA